MRQACGGAEANVASRSEDTRKNRLKKQGHAVLLNICNSNAFQSFHDCTVISTERSEWRNLFKQSNSIFLVVATFMKSCNSILLNYPMGRACYISCRIVIVRDDFIVLTEVFPHLNCTSHLTKDKSNKGIQIL
jgi:hypothetical protein